MFRLSQWRPRHLLTAWIAWWVAVPLIALSRALLAIQQLASEQGTKSSVSLNYGDGALSLTVIDAGQTVWTNSVGLLPATLIIAVPPLLLWMAWLRARPRGGRLSADAPQMLNEPVDIPRAAARERTYDNNSTK